MHEVALEERRLREIASAPDLRERPEGCALRTVEPGDLPERIPESSCARDEARALYAPVRFHRVRTRVAYAR